MKKVLAVLAFLAIVASPAFAAIQNVKVSGDIDSTYLNRNHFGLGVKAAGFPSQEQGLVKQSVFFTQTRLRIDADLSDNVSTTVGLINERAWNAEGNNDTNVDLYLASATFREFLYSPLSITVGRQVFAYGNGLILGDGGVNNVSSGNFQNIANDFTKRTAYDGIKAILDYKPLTLDLIYFKNNQRIVTGALDAGVKSSSDVYGLNANYQLGDASNTVVEGYLFSRVNGDNNLATATDKKDTLYVPGLRVSTNPIKGLNVQAEGAWQVGNKVVNAGTTTEEAEKRGAFAGQLMTSYALPIEEKYKPSVNASYTYVSGDKNGGATYASDRVKSAKVYRSWDVFNEAQGSGTIYNSLFNLTNMSIVAAGGQITPLEDVTTSVLWSGLWLNNKTTGANPLALLQPDGSTLPTLATTGRKDLGNEYDVNVNYAYTEDVTFGLSLGWFVPGKTFGGANDTTASQAVAHVLVNF